jgi:hypothetical protein
MALNQVPQVGQDLGNTQTPILNNFNNINANFLVDHVEFASGADSGKHKKITFPVLYSTTGTMPAFGVDERGLFAAQTTLTGVNEIFVWKSASFGGGLASQRFSITQNRGNNPAENANSYGAALGSLPNTTGYSMLPNGTFLQWMVVNFAAGAASRSFNWPIPFVGYVFNVQITLYAAAGFSNTTANVSTAAANVLTEVRISQSNTNQHTYMIFGIGTRY